MIEGLPEAEIIGRIEAALYSSGRPLSIEELTRASGTNSKEKTLKVISDLMKTTKSVFKALEIARLEDGNFVFQLKPNFTAVIRRFAQQPLLGTAVLKTLSYIAYEQPITSRRIVDIRGTQAYRHLRELKQTGFIESENLGRLNIYRTAKKFQNYFGVTNLDSLKSLVLPASDKEIEKKQDNCHDFTRQPK
jgi:segregation and condensation protein B